jgi:protein-S-isoprenylcysteine O-methyltransferase Ste14
VRFLRRTPVRTFLLYPLVTLVWESFLNRGGLRINLVFLPLMVWGYLQYRLCGLYRAKHGGGGPGLEKPPVRLVSDGPYAYSRNPMYLGHVLFLIGLALTLHSLVAALIAVGTTLWFHRRVLEDERNLARSFGEPYLQYRAKVARWIPGLF